MSVITLRTIGAVIAFIGASAASAAFDCSSFPVRSYVKADGTRLGIVFTTDQISRAPTWQPGAGEPPLTISQVTKIAQDWAAAQFKRFDSARIQSISLSESGCPGKRYWYYAVDFTLTIDGNLVTSAANFVGVLMDGTVVGAAPVKDAF